MRRVRWDRWVLGGGAILTIVFAVVLTTWALDERADDQALDDRGVAVVAEVVKVSVDDDGDSTTSDVVVRFDHPGDAPTVTETEITYYDDFEADFPDAESEGVRIEFDPENPERARIEGESHNRAAELFVGAGACVLIGIGLTVATVVVSRDAGRA